MVNYYVSQGEPEAIEASNHLESLFDVCTVTADRETPATLFEFSRAYGVSSYDAAYLMLARSQGSALASLDKKMRRVARKLEIDILLEKSVPYFSFWIVELPGVYEINPSGAKIISIPCHHRHIMNQRRGRYQGISIRSRIWHM